MKRVKNIFWEIVSPENLYAAAHKAARGKRSRQSVQRFLGNLDAELYYLQTELIEQTYQPGPYRTFTIYDNKPRLISAAPFRDRVVHHALCNIVEPIYERSFIFDSYACRKGKGTHAAVRRFQQFMQGADYVLKCDIRKYFPSIDHQILKTLLRRKIGCPETLYLLDTIIDASNPQIEATDWFPGDDLFSPFDRRRGLPIGNQTSQFLGNVYLDALDHYVKETLRVRRYIRYVDDFVLLADDKATLWEWKTAMDAFLGENLRVRIHARKHLVQPVTEGTAFLGYRCFPTHRRLLPASGYRFAARLRTLARAYRAGRLSLPQVRQPIAAWLGHARNADTYRLRQALLSGVKFQRAMVGQKAAPGGTTNRMCSVARTETGTLRRIGTTTGVFAWPPQHQLHRGTHSQNPFVARSTRAVVLASA
jgi:RNA-directed DNA polymerase